MPQTTQNLVGVLLVNADGTQNSLYPLGDKFANIEEITLTGIDIGIAPTVHFHARGRGGDLSVVDISSPDIGTWESIKNSGGVSSRMSVVGGRPWYTVRDAARVAENDSNLSTENRFTFPPSKTFYTSYRLFDDSTKRMVGADVAGGDIVYETSLAKPAWLTNPNNTAELPDIVIGTWSGGYDAGVSGNTIVPLKVGGSTGYYYQKLGGKPYQIGDPLLRKYYQSGAPTSDGLYDAYIELEQSSPATGGVFRNASLGNSYNINSAGAGLSTKDYYMMIFGAYIGGFGGDYSNVQMLYADIFFSSSRSRVVASNSPVYLNSTDEYDLAPVTAGHWNNTTKVIRYSIHDREKILPYRHVIVDNNPLTAPTVYENVSYVSI